MDERYINKAIAFYNNIIVKFIYGDIEKAISAGLNFMVAMALLAYTDFIGGLISGDLGFLSDKDCRNYYKYKTKRKQLSREERFEIALKYFGNSSDYLQLKIYFLNHGKPLNIYKAFRCGMIHEYFTKTPPIIHNNPQVNHYVSTDKGIGWHKDNKREILRFHTNAYYRDFKEGVDRIFKKEIYEDKHLLSMIIESLKRIERNFNSLIYGRIIFKKHNT
jgi:hypothetical protein